MPSRLRNQCAMPLLALTSLFLSACASVPNSAPLLTGQCPRPAQLPAAILQIDTRPSTDTLLQAQQWLQDSEALLSSGTPK